MSKIPNAATLLWLVLALSWFSSRCAVISSPIPGESSTLESTTETETTSTESSVSSEWSTAESSSSRPESSTLETSSSPEWSTLETSSSSSEWSTSESSSSNPEWSTSESSFSSPEWSTSEPLSSSPEWSTSESSSSSPEWSTSEPSFSSPEWSTSEPSFSSPEWSTSEPSFSSPEWSTSEPSFSSPEWSTSEPSFSSPEWSTSEPSFSSPEWSTSEPSFSSPEWSTSEPSFSSPEWSTSEPSFSSPEWSTSEPSFSSPEWSTSESSSSSPESSTLESTIATTPAAKLAAAYGFPMEKHVTVTSDGFILTMYLMRQNLTEGKKAQTVFLSHGLFTSSDCWFINTPEEILPFKLYREGYHVMLGNFRETSHSPQHQELPRNSTTYWDFSWHQLGVVDVPAMIDYTLKVTEQDKLFLIGHSMGTTTAFVLLSERPEYNDKIHKFIALAPSVFLRHSPGPIHDYLTPLLKMWGAETLIRKYIAPTGQIPRDDMYKTGSKLIRKCGQNIINENKLLEKNITFNSTAENALCRIVFESIIDIDDMTQEQLELAATMPLETTSVNNVLHYAQSMNYDGFRQYDHGMMSNVYYYGSIYAPEYNLTRVTCPVSLYWSRRDSFTAPEDVETLREKLPESTLSGMHEMEGWSHTDYLFPSPDDTIQIFPLIMKSIKSDNY